MSNKMKLTKFNPVLEVEENLVGTDYVVGDIHGMYSLLMQELINIGFDSRKDRLFSVGDLVDRGPENKEVIELLKEDWFFAVCGNHEQMCIENVYHSHEYPELYRRHASNGGVWFCLEEFHKQKQIADIFSCLPVIIELKVDNLKIGIIHADVGDNWRLLKRNLKSIVGRKVLNHEDFHKSLWGRTKIAKAVDTICYGIDHVFLGHTPVRNIVKLGNCHFIDRGSCNHQMFFTIIDIKTYLKKLNESN